MSKFVLTVFGGAALLGALVLAGCRQQGQAPATPEGSPGASQPAAPSGAQQPAAGQHAGHAPHQGHSQYEAALASLSAEDRALAEEQKVCPVSGQALGSMGTPVKVTVAGREVLLCCQGCEQALRADPEKYLAKLDQGQ